jgi:hypothetical protein
MRAGKRTGRADGNGESRLRKNAVGFVSRDRESSEVRGPPLSIIDRGDDI